MWSSTSTASCAQMRMLAELLLADALEQRADAGLVHFAAQEVDLGHQRGDVRRGLAHAEADLQHGGRGAAEGGVEVQRLGAVGQQEAAGPSSAKARAWPSVVRPARRTKLFRRRCRGCGGVSSEGGAASCVGSLAGRVITGADCRERASRRPMPPALRRASMPFAAGQAQHLRGGIQRGQRGSGRGGVDGRGAVLLRQLFAVGAEHQRRVQVARRAAGRARAAAGSGARCCRPGPRRARRRSRPGRHRRPPRRAGRPRGRRRA